MAQGDGSASQVAGGVLQWGAIGSSLSPVNDGDGSRFRVADDTVISYKLGGSLFESGTLYVLDMDGCQDVVETSCPIRALGT